MNICSHVSGTSLLEGDRKRRQQVIGEAFEEVSDLCATHVYVSKSENTRYTLVNVLKSHFLFSQLRENEIDDVVDEMQVRIVSLDPIALF